VKKKPSLNLIVNMQSSNQSTGGSHWVALLKRGNIYFYFDSFGAKPPIEVKQYCKTKLAYNSYIIQNLNSEACGLYCFALLHYVKNNKGNLLEVVNDFINMFEDDTRRNDQILQLYLSKMKKV
jgi:hypothetical protein